MMTRFRPVAMPTATCVTRSSARARSDASSSVSGSSNAARRTSTRSVIALVIALLSRLGRAIVDAGRGWGHPIRGPRDHAECAMMTRMPDTAIRLRGVRKRFGQVTAVDGLDLDVTTGVCFGLLGPNGAGKTTTMRLLTAQAIADEGVIEVLGFRLPEESREARALSGVVPQNDNLDVELTVRQNLAVYARLYRIPRSERGPAIDRALARARLPDRAADPAPPPARLPARPAAPVQPLPGGMPRRLLIARGLVHDPELALLDEPTVG